MKGRKQLDQSRIKGSGVQQVARFGLCRRGLRIMHRNSQSEVLVLDFPLDVCYSIR